MNNMLTIVINELINDIIFLYPETSHEIAEEIVATMIRNPNMLLALATMVKDKRGTIRITE
jgi:hypothetical protein